MPGGDMYEYSKSISSIGKENIREFVKNGGCYLGVCAGAYFALGSVYWRGNLLPMEPLGLVRGKAVGPLDEVVSYPGYGMTEIALTESGRNLLSGLNETIWSLYYWGPALNVDSSSSVSVIGVYKANGLPAIVTSMNGSGRIVLFGIHPEIEENSLRDGSTWGQNLDDKGSDWPLVKRLVTWLLKS
jgi:glutamine amidotransferase-like uncharacterized protein